MKILPLFSVLFLLFSCGRKTDESNLIKRDLIQAVYASGKIFPENGYKVYSKLPGYIEKIHVHVGDSIKIGQPLITIKSELSELNVNAARNLYELAQKNAAESSALLNAIRQDVSTARSKFELDSVNYYRFVNLYKENAAAKTQLDASKTQFEISSQNYQKAFSNYISTRDRLRTELENARIQYDAQLSNKSDYTLVSAVNGKVYDIVPKEGELIGTQLALLEIGDAHRYYVELSVDETDIALIRPGQEILYSIDAYKDLSFTGIVHEVYPRIAQSNKTSKVVAAITLKNDLTIFSGMSVEANIIITRKKAALVIPREFILGSNKVILSTGDTVLIQKGAEDLQYIEVISGLKDDATIIKP